MEKKYSAIGGQALIEGVMMRGRKYSAIALRKPSGEIEVTSEPIRGITTTKWMKVPIARGMIALCSSMAVGVKALTYSAESFAEGEADYEPGKFEKWIETKLGDKADSVMTTLSIALALVMAFVLFGALPTLAARFIGGLTDSRMVMTVMEGILKIVIFVLYLAIISSMRDIKRVFQYHGAEHKSIHCLESGRPVELENVRSFTTLHPRCGTSFLFIVLMVSIIVFSFVSWSNVLMRIALKVLLLPVIAGVSYEIIRWAGRSSGAFVGAISWPGLMMQKLTTKEPDDRQLEVAIAALNKVLELEGSDV